MLGVAVAANASVEVSPYVGQETRDIKALSAQEIADLIQGKGMGMAKAAELNRFPGPRHVLDLKQALKLDKAQVAKSEQLFQNMQKKAQALGEKIVSLERQLDQSFQRQTIDENTLQRTLTQLATLKAELRFVHLDAHLKQKKILKPAQVSEYVKLRGYGSNHDSYHGGNHDGNQATQHQHHKH